MAMLAKNNLRTFCKPELWGGIECTINRVGNSYKDQLSLAGHYERHEDLKAIAGLRIKTLRYPVLMERHYEADKETWDLTASRLEEIRSYGITPIAGLLHHGSGPEVTSLDDPCFPEKLAAFAGKVAERFPWLNFYTPVNEPLTTARFSGLYGHWYPHKKSSLSFLTMLLNQLKGTVLAMFEIRKINPCAKLVQTEDLAKTHSTPLLAYQAAFENHRRWLTYDLLCGRVDENHPLWNYILSSGIIRQQLSFFINNPCPPDIMGLNYYVTSERWLDEKTGEYPDGTHGGNGIHNYADTEVVRARPGTVQGFSLLAVEAWNRYGLPMAVTEVHLGCTREEQMRWFKEIWDESCHLSEKGINILAVTAWSLLGSFDWDSLLTKNERHYEAGVFDIRSGTLRPTAMAGLLKNLSDGRPCVHPLVQQKGWWHNQRVAYKFSPGGPSPVLIIDQHGTLGYAFKKICKKRSIPFIVMPGDQSGKITESAVESAIQMFQPWAVINASGYIEVDDAEVDEEACFRINSFIPAILAKACRKHNIRMLTFSSDLVFDGKKTTPYTEADEVKPLNTYGKSKALAESLVLKENEDALIIRSGTYFGPWDEYNFVYSIVDSVLSYGFLIVPDDIVISPAYIPDLVHAALDILIDGERGIWHLSNEGEISWYALAVAIVKRQGLDPSCIIAQSAATIDFKAIRPAYSVLSTNKGYMMRELHQAIDDFYKEKNIRREARYVNNLNNLYR
jgi:dTDP-4-dehydrorhamnose reductase